MSIRPNWQAATLLQAEETAQIRPHYHFNESCQETVPQAITAFLESDDFEPTLAARYEQVRSKFSQLLGSQQMRPHLITHNIIQRLCIHPRERVRSA